MGLRSTRVSELQRVNFPLAVIMLVGVWIVSSAGCWSQPRLALPTLTPTPRFSDDEVRAVAVIATYEAQVFPELQKSQAYTAIAWTMRNRVEIGFGGAVSYADERVLGRYSSYQDHKGDPPDPRAVEIARQVLSAETIVDDPTRGARNPTRTLSPTIKLSATPALTGTATITVMPATFEAS